MSHELDELSPQVDVTHVLDGNASQANCSPSSAAR